jgi:hypothetical protein
VDHQERFILLFPAARARQVSVFMLGCGAIGSWLGMFLAKMGVTKFELMDYDVVNAENIGVSAFDRSYMYESKVAALSELIQLHGNEGMEINTHPRKFTRYSWVPMECNVVVAAVDNIDARKLLWRKFCHHSTMSKELQRASLFIDPRMGAESFEIAATGGGSDKRALRGWQRKSYERTFWKDVAPAPCGMAAAPYTAAECAAEVAKTIRIWAQDDAKLLAWQFKDLKSATVRKGVELDGTFKAARKLSRRLKEARAR